MKYLAWLVVALVPGLAWANDKTPASARRSLRSQLRRLPRRGIVAGAIRGEKSGSAGVHRLRMSCCQTLWTTPCQVAKEYEAKGVQFLGIDANQQDGVSQIARFAKEAGVEFPILKDVNNVLADQLRVQRSTRCSSWTSSAEDPVSRPDR